MGELPFLSRYSGETLDELIAMEGQYRTDSIVMTIHQLFGIAAQHASTPAARMAGPSDGRAASTPWTFHAFALAAEADAALRGRDLVDAQFAGAVSPFDVEARALRTATGAIPLTKLEFGVMKYLDAHAGRVVTRDELLQHVWDQSFGGSNVVDAVVKSLRRKLGPLGSALETVIGHGYRFTGFPQRPVQTAH